MAVKKLVSASSSLRDKVHFSSDHKIILTGDRPTGSLHLGHYLGSLKNRVEMQNQVNASGEYIYRQFILIADMQALTDNAGEPQKISENIINVALDYLAIGLDPSISTIFIQSQIPELSELTMYLLNLLTVNQLERNPTVKEEIKARGFENKLPVGFFVYPVSQAADITGFKADLVPVGADQIPMIEDTNALVRKFNQTYKSNVLKECQAVVPENFSRLVGIDGASKMSKSLGNAIYLKDTNDELWVKIKQMYTDPNHIRVEDPGQVEGNVVFTYLDAFDDDRAKVLELKTQYRQGGLGDMKLKKYLLDVLESKLSPIREKRLEFEKDTAEVYKMLQISSQEAREVVKKTLTEVKQAIGIQYF
jgi:tryptophanyl-tRNA synthetase